MRSQQRQTRRSIRGGVLEIIAVIVACAFIAYLAHYYSAVVGLIPRDYVLPIYVIIIVIGGYTGIRIIMAIIGRLVEPRFGVTRSHTLQNFFQIAASVLLVVAVFALYGQNLTNWLIGAGFLGIVLGLAAQQVLGNIFAGLALLSAHPFDIGDRITLGTSVYNIVPQTYPHENLTNGYSGVVQDVGIFYTKVLLDDGVPAVFPNSVVIGSLVLNHSKLTERSVKIRMDLDKRISYEEFKKELFAVLKSKESQVIDAEKLNVEIVDVGLATYQVMIAVWAKSQFEEPIKTLVIQDALEVQRKLTLDRT